MRQLVFFALACFLTSGHLIAATAPKHTEGLKPEEYAAVGEIYNSELSSLGRRALYPICIELPAGVPTKPLLKFLQGFGYAVSEPSVCEPGMAQKSRHHPKDYTHGMRIHLHNPERDSDGTISVRVEVGDLTVRPGEHLAALLRDGIYHLKLDDKEQWQIIGYMKKYDSADEKRGNCDNPQPAMPPKPGQS